MRQKNTGLREMLSGAGHVGGGGEGSEEWGGGREVRSGGGVEGYLVT